MRVRPLTLGVLAAAWAAAAIPAAAAAPEQAPANFVAVANQVAPAVVNISATQVARRQLPPGLSPEAQDFFERFFGPRMDQPQTRQSLGSGVIVDPKGYVLTNYHVVAEATEIRVLMKNRQEYPAKVVGTDPLTDLAVLQLQGKGPWNAVSLGNSDAVQVGSWVVAVGSPFGLADTVTAGIISAKDRAIGQGPYDDFLQTDASINPGNSGGPLVNMAGEVVGINTAIFSQTGGNLGIGFAIPSNLARKVFTDLVKTGRVQRGWLGVTIQPVTPELARQFKLEEVTGALVSSVADNSPASQAGLQRGDIILQINDQAVTVPSELSRTVANLRPGTQVTLTVLRNSERRQIQVKLGELQQPQQPAGQPGGQQPSEPEETTALGMSLSEITPQIAEELKARNREGVVITGVAPGSPAALAGLAPGDIIREVNQKPVANLQAFQKIASGVKPGEDLLLFVERGGDAIYLVLERPAPQEQETPQ